MASSLIAKNVRAFRATYPEAPKKLARTLKELSDLHGVSLLDGDVQLLDGKWYITHAGLLRIAYKDRCTAIEVEPAFEFSSPGDRRFVFRATIRRAGKGGVFVGYGDADPGNITPRMHGAELRIAETRAVNRALRKAYGIGLCSVEELGAANCNPPWPPTPASSNVRVAEMPVRDRLVTLIRRHRLDSDEVKRYAAEFCGTETLRDASRSLVEDFVAKVENWAKDDVEPAETSSELRGSAGGVVKRQIAGLGLRAEALDPALAGLFLVRIASARLLRQRCTMKLEVLEPEEHAGLQIQTTLELAEGRLWKLAWLLRDFHYDTKLLSIDQVDPAKIVGLTGVVKISEGDLVSGRSYRIDACAPASAWQSGKRSSA